MFDLSSYSYPYFEEINPGIIRMFPGCGTDPQNKVLDVGCGRASLSGEIKSQGYTVWGIESSKIACEIARKRIDILIECDLTNTCHVSQKISEERFDYIIFSDVLEHLYDPLAMLKYYKAFLRPGGRVLISLPNVCNWVMRLKFMVGIFKYEDTGVMDRTHVRFFTFRTAQILVKEAGLIITKVDSDPYLIRAVLPILKSLLKKPSKDNAAQQRAIMESPAYKRYQKWVYPIEYRICSLLKGLFAFRIIIVAEGNGL